MKSRKNQTVAVAYPYPSQISARFHHSLLMLVVRDAATTRRVNAFVANSSGANVATPRNEIVATFLKTDNDYLWFIDTDMVFDDDLVERLIAVAHPEQRPIVGALCFSLQKGMQARPTVYIVRDDGKVGVQWDYPRDRLFEVDATGTGCLLIHRSVFEKMGTSYSEAFPYFMETSLGELPVGEDITFCIRARRLGFPIYVDSSVKVGHEKTFVVDESVYDAQRLAKIAEPPLEPTYVVIASKDRREMLAGLLSRLGSAEQLFVMDNGYSPPIPNGVDCAGWPLHRMWNHGLDLAEQAAKKAGHERWNVAVLNDDLEVEADFLSRLEHGLRANDDIWISYPDYRGVIPAGQLHQFDNPELAGQTMSGWAYMLRGETGLRLDEQFAWWYGDSDLERQVRTQGKGVVSVGGCHAVHLHPMESSRAPERVAQIREDEKRFADKWGIDPDSLWLHQHPEFGQ